MYACILCGDHLQSYHVPSRGPVCFLGLLSSWCQMKQLIISLCPGGVVLSRPYSCFRNRSWLTPLTSPPTRRPGQCSRSGYRLCQDSVAEFVHLYNDVSVLCADLRRSSLPVRSFLQSPPLESCSPGLNQRKCSSTQRWSQPASSINHAALQTCTTYTILIIKTASLPAGCSSRSSRDLKSAAA